MRETVRERRRGRSKRRGSKEERGGRGEKKERGDREKKEKGEKKGGERGREDGCAFKDSLCFRISFRFDMKGTYFLSFHPDYKHFSSLDNILHTEEI